MNEENRRSWKTDKRSWIFYREEIKKNSYIVQGEVEGNNFIFDCETGRLSIWSGQWESFIEVGVSSLIEAVDAGNERNGVASKTKIHIFYKGIEFDKRSVKKDFVILESIDIKGELRREYVNINRGTFTAKGEIFFEEELYPGLLDVVRKVLRYLARNTTIGEKQIESEDGCQKKNFVEIIPNIVEKKCKQIVEIKKKRKTESLELNEILRELLTLTVVISVLAYYAMLDEWHVSEKLHRENNKSNAIWGKLVERVDAVLAESENEIVLKELADLTKFFRIKVYGEDYKQLYNRNVDAVLNFRNRFTQFFLPNNHWAIMQVRKNKFSSWTSYPILLNNDNDNDNYSKLVSFPHSEDDEKVLKEWGDKLCEAVKQFDDKEDSSQQVLVNWLLKNIPTVAMFSDKTGNIRVNVLANRIYPSTFMNDNFKYLLLERILETAKDSRIQRFSTITWQGYESQACVYLPYNVYFVKRGYFSSYAYYKTIIPFDANILKLFADIIFNSSKEQLAIIEVLERLDVTNCLKQSMSTATSIDVRNTLQKAKEDNSMWSIVATISEAIGWGIEEMEYKPTKEFEELLEINNAFEAKNSVSLWARGYIYILEMQLETEGKGQNTRVELLSRLKQEQSFECLCNIWMYVILRMDTIIKSKSKINKIYEESIKVDILYQAKIRRLCEYLGDKVPYGFEPEEVRMQIKKFEEELLRLFCDMEYSSVFLGVEKLKRANRFWVDKVKQSYELKQKMEMGKNGRKGI